jgi:hypothetical protein
MEIVNVKSADKQRDLLLHLTIAPLHRWPVIQVTSESVRGEDL